jgi:serpin B
MWTALGFADLGMEEADAAFKGLTDLLLSLDPKVQLEIANAIWYRLGLHVRSDFVRLVRDYFGAPVSGLDFASPRSVQVVNQWASERTHGRISKVLDSINPLDVMFLANAIYFKGLWTYRFEESQTQEDVFHLPGGSTIPCRMMLQTVDDLPYQRRANLAAVDLPYGSGHFSMTILLPEPGIDVDSLLLQISSPELQSLFSGFEKRKVTIWLPKFRIRYGKELSPELKRLGMQTAFDPDRADFSRLFEDQLQPYISSVLHRSYVQVDEAGTEAAAVTVVIVGVTSVGGGENAVLFRVDRPFIFLIRERDSGALLFAGRITEPQWEE